MKKIFGSKIFGFIIGFLRTIFVIVIMFYLAFVVVQRVSGNKSVFGYRLFTVATGSMSGVYEINDVIAVKDCAIKRLKVGDDIAYQGTRGGLEGMLITHRIIKIEKDESGKLLFTTKGVNAPAADPVVMEEQVLGRVIGIVPFISLLNHIVKSQLGFFLFIFCPLVLIIVLEVLQTITDIQLENHEIQKIVKEKDIDNDNEDLEGKIEIVEDDEII